MKKTIFILIMLMALPALPALAGQSLDKAMLETIHNEADRTATRAVIYRINVEDKAITCNLFKGDELIARKRVYAYEGDFMPFTLLGSEVRYLDGNAPAEWWDVRTIKLWMSDRQVKDEDGKIAITDPYLYTDKATKEDLLKQITELEK